MSGFVEMPIETTEIPIITPTPMCNCHKCKKEIKLVNAIACKFCNKCECKNKDENDEDNYEEDNYDSDYECECVSKRVNKFLFCKKCTDKCYSCEVRGCDYCIDVVCCDCGVSMCDKCRNRDILCGCYGECYTCDSDVNRGSDGWPCNECEKWYCRYCRYTGENTCDDCNPNDESDDDTNESDDNNETPNNETPNNE